MKHLVAIIRTAVREMQRRGIQPERELVLAFTADEENGFTLSGPDGWWTTIGTLSRTAPKQLAKLVVSPSRSGRTSGSISSNQDARASRGSD